MTTPLSARATGPQRGKALLAGAAVVVLALAAGVIWHMRTTTSPPSSPRAERLPAATSPRAGSANMPSPAPAVPQQTGRLVIHTRPEGARIYLDGRATPYRSPVNIGLPAGRHRITVEYSGFGRETDYVVVKKDQTAQLRFELKRR